MTCHNPASFNDAWPRDQARTMPYSLTFGRSLGSRKRKRKPGEQRDENHGGVAGKGQDARHGHIQRFENLLPIHQFAVGAAGGRPGEAIVDIAGGEPWAWGAIAFDWRGRRLEVYEKLEGASVVVLGVHSYVQMFLLSQAMGRLLVCRDSSEALAFL